MFALEPGGAIRFSDAGAGSDAFHPLSPKDRQTMNKGELIEAVASHLGESKATASRALDAVLQSLTEGVQKDGKVSIAGFGTFRKKDRKERTAINPATKEPMHIPASSTVGFTPSQALKDSVHTPAAAGAV